MPNTPFTEHAARLTRDLISVLVSDADSRELAADIAAIAGKLKEAAARPELVEVIDPHVVEGHIEDDITPATSARNPIAPPMYIERSGEESRCEIVLARQYQGPPERVHGGILALMLDQVLGHAAHAGDQPRAFTRYLNIAYEAATPLGVPLLVRGRISRVDGRKRFLRGEVMLGDEVMVSAEGLWVAPRVPAE